MTAQPLPVLVGVDGSDDGLRAVQYAMAEATVRGSGLRIVHAVDDAVMAGVWGVVYDPSILEEAGQAAIEAAVAQVTAHGFAADRVRAEVVMGSPTAALTRLSEEAAMVVVGRRSISGLERIFVGSTSVGIAASARCPVIMISAASNPDDTGARKRVGVGVDTSIKSRAALRWAFSEAVVRAARVVVTHVVPTPPPGLFRGDRSAQGEDRARLVAAGTAALERVVAPFLAEYPDVACELDTTYGGPVDTLVERSGNLDLLILGAHGVGLPGFTLGGVVRGVMAHATCPVGIVRTWPGDKFGIQ